MWRPTKHTASSDHARFAQKICDEGPADLFNCELVPSRVWVRKLRLTAVLHRADASERLWEYCGSAHDLTAPAFLNLIVDCELEGSSCSDLTAPPFSLSIVNWRAPRSALTLMTPHNISPPSNVSATPHAPSGRPSPKGSVSSSIRRSKYSSVVIAAQRNECGASDTLIRIE